MKFIKQYKNRLSNESCDYIMKLMTIHNDLTNEGNTIHGVDKRFKPKLVKKPGNVPGINSDAYGFTVPASEYICLG